MRAKYKKSKVFSYFEKANAEFLVRSHAISVSKQLLNTSCHLW